VCQPWRAPILALPPHPLPGGLLEVPEATHHPRHPARVVRHHGQGPGGEPGPHRLGSPAPGLSGRAGPAGRQRLHRGHQPGVRCGDRRHQQALAAHRRWGPEPARGVGAVPGPGRRRAGHLRPLFWPGHRQAVRHGLGPGHGVQRPPPAPEAICGLRLPHHCLCPRFPPELWRVPGGARRPGPALRLEPRHHAAHPPAPLPPPEHGVQVHDGVCRGVCHGHRHHQGPSRHRGGQGQQHPDLCHAAGHAARGLARLGAAAGQLRRRRAGRRRQPRRAECAAGRAGARPAGGRTDLADGAHGGDAGRRHRLLPLRVVPVLRGVPAAALHLT
ncbi:hypothetical protein APUTEX25_000745, partial [Auxenochlorella protothecoides]